MSADLACGQQGYSYRASTLDLTCDGCGAVVDASAVEAHGRWHDWLYDLRYDLDEALHRPNRRRRLVLAEHLRWLP